MSGRGSPRTDTLIPEWKGSSNQSPVPHPAQWKPNELRAYPRSHLAGWTGIMQADAFAGFTALYESPRKPAPIIEAACWCFDLAKLTKAPIAVEAVQKIDVLFEIERGINGLDPDKRVAVRCEKSKPLCDHLRQERDRQSDQLRPLTMASIHPLSE